LGQKRPQTVVFTVCSSGAGRARTRLVSVDRLRPFLAQLTPNHVCIAARRACPGPGHAWRGVDWAKNGGKRSFLRYNVCARPRPLGPGLLGWSSADRLRLFLAQLTPNHVCIAARRACPVPGHTWLGVDWAQNGSKRSFLRYRVRTVIARLQFGPLGPGWQGWSLRLPTVCGRFLVQLTPSHVCTATIRARPGPGRKSGQTRLQTVSHDKMVTFRPDPD